MAAVSTCKAKLAAERVSRQDEGERSRSERLPGGRERNDGWLWQDALEGSLSKGGLGGKDASCKDPPPPGRIHHHTFLLESSLEHLESSPTFLHS